jgi:hypothetical protein
MTFRQKNSFPEKFSSQDQGEPLRALTLVGTTPEENVFALTLVGTAPA